MSDDTERDGCIGCDIIICGVSSCYDCPLPDCYLANKSLNSPEFRYWYVLKNHRVPDRTLSGLLGVSLRSIQRIHKRSGKCEVTIKPNHPEAMPVGAIK